MPQTTMQAISIDKFGGIDELKLQTLPVPEVGPDEVLIRIESAGVGVWDPWEREGEFAKMFDIEPTFPVIIGSDGAGTVIRVGTQVTRFKAGDRVYAIRLMNPKGGFYAEQIVVNADNVSRIPDALTIEQAGALPVDAMTALQGLDDTLKLKQGESVMIFGASGGIGHFAVQLAKRMGARVFAVASGEDGVEFVKKLGADNVVDGRTDDVIAAAREFAPDGIDAALLTAGGKAAERALESLRDDGRVAYPSGVEEPKVRSGVQVSNYDNEPSPQAIEKLNHLIESNEHGPFQVHIAGTFPLGQAADAHRAIDVHYLGKLALLP